MAWPYLWFFHPTTKRSKSSSPATTQMNSANTILSEEKPGPKDCVPSDWIHGTDPDVCSHSRVVTQWYSACPVQWVILTVTLMWFRFPWTVLRCVCLWGHFWRDKTAEGRPTLNMRGGAPSHELEKGGSELTPRSISLLPEDTFSQLLLPTCCHCFAVWWTLMPRAKTISFLLALLL